MRRDPKLEHAIMDRIVAHDYSRIQFESYSTNGGGYEDVDYPEWAPEEAHHIEQLVLKGFLGREEINDAPWIGVGRSDVYKESYVFMTPAGYDWYENRGFLKKAIKNIISNVPTVIVSVVTALAIAWLTGLLGLPD